MYHGLMDARYKHTAIALREAVLQLASERPIERITAVELAAAAGVTRRTLYNHCSSPADLLTGILRAELDELSDDSFEEICRGMPISEAWRRGDHELARHLLLRAEIYSAGTAEANGHMSPTLSHMIVDDFEEGVLRVFTRNDAPGFENMQITARFISYGIVGAIEAWLLTPDRDPNTLASGIINSIPNWVFDGDTRVSGT